MLPVRGVHTALATPFAEDGSVDLDTYAALAHRQLDQGIHGLVACGTTGETPTLTHDEWAALVRATVDVAGGNAPVTAGVGTNNTRTTVQNTERAAELGADAGLLVLPYYNKPDRRGMIAHVRSAAAVGLPLMLYHVPGRTGQRVPAEQLAELASVDGVVAIKEATGDVRYGGDLLVRTDAAVLSGDDFSFLQLMATGGTGVVSVVSNVAPAHTVAIHDHHVAGRVAQASEALLELWPLITFLFSDSNPVPLKAAMAAMGLCHPDLRLPLSAWQGPSPAPILGALGLA